MPETTSAPDSDPEDHASADLKSGRNVFPVSDGAAFARSGKALAKLGRAFLKFSEALRDDVAAASRRAAKRLRILGRDAAQRLRDLDHSTAKRRAGALAQRSAAVWSRLVRPRAPMPEIISAEGNKRRRRKLVLRSLAATGAASLIFFVGVFAWALGDVPWDEIAEGTLRPVVVLETSDGKPLVRQGPIQGPYATHEDFPRHLIDAVLTAEDRRFYDHSGIDLR
ncbi:MAG: penicillin-binding protein, partial [Mesorhizobium sp.]